MYAIFRRDGLAMAGDPTGQSTIVTADHAGDDPHVAREGLKRTLSRLNAPPVIDEVIEYP
jgi:hypothetical protein